MYFVQQVSGKLFSIRSGPVNIRAAVSNAVDVSLRNEILQDIGDGIGVQACSFRNGAVAPVPGNDGQDDLGTAEAEVQPADVGGKYLYEIQCFHEHLFTIYYYVICLLFSCYSHSSGQEGDLIFRSKSSSGLESLEKHCTALTVAA